MAFLHDYHMILAAIYTSIYFRSRGHTNADMQVYCISQATISLSGRYTTVVQNVASHSSPRAWPKVEVKNLQSGCVLVRDCNALWVV
jgi:hypothetical protein